MPITKHPKTGKYVAGAATLVKASMSSPADEGSMKNPKKPTKKQTSKSFGI